MGLLNKAKAFLKKKGQFPQALIILFPGKNSLLLKAFLKEFSDQLEKDRSDFMVHSLNINRNFEPLEHLVQKLLHSTHKKDSPPSPKVTIWPAFLLPGTFQKGTILDHLKKYQRKGEINLMPPLDFQKEIYPFLLKAMGRRLNNAS